MLVCENCKTEWTWKQTLKSSFVLTTSMTCPYCGEKQYATPKSKKRTFLLNMLILLPLLLQALFEMGVWTTFSLMIGFFILVMISMPFWMSVQNEETFKIM
ncbi:TIGR04104 family putative zinc finger protein [Planococcus massiliensis]|uniref:TIGR04104 family putative zinc finger protein n=1 Tax=Planococcus massiliensis TaxID=1499687 RepID=UPI000696D215|nr:TIGR04104 family putative zinc finger protein [Planococcus massiliensis]